MSNIWHDINPRRISPEKFMAVIEIPKGVKNKYEMDKETGLLRLDRRTLHINSLSCKLRIYSENVCGG